MNRSGIIRAFLIALLLALPCFAGEVAILKNGFSIQHKRREVIGEITRLYTSADGSNFIDIQTEDIDHFEQEPDPPAPVPSLPASASRVGSLGRAAGFPARPKTDLTQLVNETSGRYRLDPDLVNSVIKAESAFNNRALSPKGAQGLMQLMPGTASQLGVHNAFDPQANVEGGTKYLRELLEKYNFDLSKALAAYNAGPQKVDRYGGIPPYYETRAYVAKIVRDFNKKKAAQVKTATARKAAPGMTASPKTAAVKNAIPKKASTSRGHSGNSVVEAKSTGASE